MWIYETETGSIIDANQAATKLFDLSLPEFTSGRVDALGSAHWQISGDDLISRSESPWTGKLVRIRIVQLDLDDKPQNRRLSLVPLSAIDPIALLSSASAEDAVQRLPEYGPHSLPALQTDEYEEPGARERLPQQERLEILGRLAGKIAHDFNNYLTVLMGNSEALSRKLPPGPLSEMAILSTEASEYAAAMVNDLLAFAKRQALHPIVTDANLLIQQSAEMLRYTLPRNIRIDLNLDPDLWQVRVDPSQFESSLLKICLNSSEAMPEGGRITLSSRNKIASQGPTTSYHLPAEKWVEICVSDTGSGMSDEQMQRAFDPFFTTKPAGVGKGLGLSCVHGFASQSGGYVHIRSEARQGTSVLLYFPAIMPDEPAPLSISSEVSKTIPTVKIMVVEDDQLVLTHVCRQLKQMGMHALSARTGTDAVRQMEDNPDISILFTEVMLPGGMDGLQLAARAHEDRVPASGVARHWPDGIGQAELISSPVPQAS